MTTNMGGPLSGIKILDLGSMLAAPLAASVLADQGAQVIKVEEPGIGDLTRYVGATCQGVSAIFQAVNRGKRSLAMNLKDSEAQEIIQQLVQNVDIVIHNFRPGVAERLNVDYSTLSAINPDIIYLSVTGFGHEGPMAHQAAYDNVVQAFTGVAMSQANLDTGEPEQYYQIFADKITAMYASQAITAALLARERGHGGQMVRLSMVDAVTSFLWADVGGKALFKSEEAESGVESAKGVKLIKFKNGYAQAAPVKDKEFHGWCQAFDVDSSDPRVASIIDRAVNKTIVQEISQQIYKKALNMDVDETIEKMLKAGVPCAKANSVSELPDHPQMKANGLFVESEHPVAGPIIEPKNPANFSVTPSGCGFASAVLGEHSDEVLSELGFDADEISRLREKGIIA